MKVSFRRPVRAAIAALLFSICLSAEAGPRRDRAFDLPDNVVRVIKKIQKIFSVSTHDDYPVPPKP